MGNPALIMFFGLSFIALGFAFYFLPTFIAALRRKRSITGILLVNLFLGWTVIGWIAALIWALTTQDIDGLQPQVRVVSQTPAPQQQSSRLCAHCGKYSVPEANFCAHCGKSFS